MGQSQTVKIIDSIETFGQKHQSLTPFTAKISLVILLTVDFTTLMVLIWRICYWID